MDILRALMAILIGIMLMMNLINLLLSKQVNLVESFLEKPPIKYLKTIGQKHLQIQKLQTMIEKLHRLLMIHGKLFFLKVSRKLPGKTPSSTTK